MKRTLLAKKQAARAVEEERRAKAKKERAEKKASESAAEAASASQGTPLLETRGGAGKGFSKPPLTRRGTVSINPSDMAKLREQHANSQAAGQRSVVDDSTGVRRTGGGGLTACINHALAHTPQGSNQHHACSNTYSPADWARLTVHSSVQQVIALLGWRCRISALGQRLGQLALVDIWRRSLSDLTDA